MFTRRRQNFEPFTPIIYRCSVIEIFFSSSSLLSRPFFGFAFPHRCPFRRKRWVHCNFIVSEAFFPSTFGYPFCSAESFLCFCVVFHAFSFFAWSYQQLGCVAPTCVPWLTHEMSNPQMVSFRSFPRTSGVPGLRCSSVFSSRD